MTVLNPIKMKNQELLSFLIHGPQGELELGGEDLSCKLRSPVFTVYCLEDKLVWIDK